MKQVNLEYDVAFSFTQKDEGLAYSIYKLLKDRVRCFIYSEEQKKLAGTDGEMTFNKVFSQEARIVVVFQAAEWGNTKWTKIEETAIRNRGFEHGYDFVILIPTESPVSPPDWLPKNRLWIGLERWGVESAASVIEARIQEFGGQVKEMTVVEKVAQADAELKQKKKIDQILSSTEGLRMASDEFQILIKEFTDTANEIQSKLGDWHLMVFKNNKNGINLWSYNHCLTIQWYSVASNTSKGTYAFITMSDGYFDKNLYKTDHFYEYRQILSDRKQFDINEFDQNGWSDKDSRKNFMTSKQIADKYLNQFFVVVQKHRQEKSK